MTTNTQVARRFASAIVPELRSVAPPLKPLFLQRGLTTKTFRCFSSEYDYALLRQETADLFSPIAQVTSYNTEIAKIVWNSHTRMPELWITGSRYSSATSRHLQLLTSAYIDRMRNTGFVSDREYNIDEITPYVYYTNACSGYHSRVVVQLREADMKYRMSLSDLSRVDGKGLHDATRIAKLNVAVNTVNRVIRHLTEGLSDSFIEHLSGKYVEYSNWVHWVQKFTDLRELVTSIQAIAKEDIGNARVMVRSILELERA